MCAVYPDSHSFRIIQDKKDVSYFYSCPSKAVLYDDTEGILSHFENALVNNQGKKWVWIFDAYGFGIKHMMQIRVAINLAKLISGKLGESLVQIVIINKTWHIDVILNTVWLFLSNRVRGLITDKDDSVKDVIAETFYLNFCDDK